ncbi:replication protein A 70 kDa DNA-binding subunit B [Tanacetum coccineum]
MLVDQEVSFDKDKKITPISEIHPMLDSISIQGRCISIWHPHRMNAAHDPYSLDLVLQDVQNTRIQVYIKKEFMFRFQPLFEEGKCYIISNFGIAKNNGRLPLLPRRYKISFYKSTTVTRIEPFDNNTNGFILKPFNHLLDSEYHEYHENDVNWGHNPAKLINHFKKSFLNMDSEDEESKNVLVTSTSTTTKFKNQADSDEQKDNMSKHLNIHDSKDKLFGVTQQESNDALVMPTNTKTKSKKHDKSATMNKHLNTHESSANEEGSSSRKRRLIIDLNEVESEPEEESNNFIDYGFVEVKKERDDI